MLQKTDGTMAQSQQRNRTEDYSLRRNSENEHDEDDVADEDEDPAEIEVLQEVAWFEEITIWGHEVKPTSADDPYFKAMEEWTSFADKVINRQLSLAGCALTTSQRYIPTKSRKRMISWETKDELLSKVFMMRSWAAAEFQFFGEAMLGTSIF